MLLLLVLLVFDFTTITSFVIKAVDLTGSFFVRFDSIEFDLICVRVCLECTSQSLSILRWNTKTKDTHKMTNKSIYHVKMNQTNRILHPLCFVMDIMKFREPNIFMECHEMRPNLQMPILIIECSVRACHRT